MFKDKNKVLIIMLGVMALVWGTYLSYLIYSLTQSEGWINLVQAYSSVMVDEGKNPTYVKWINKILPFFFGGMFILSGLGLIRQKTWSGSFYLGIISLFTYSSLGCLFFYLGWYGYEWHFFSIFSIYLISVVVLFQKPIAEKFSPRFWMIFLWPGKPLFRKVQLKSLRPYIFFSLGFVGLITTFYSNQGFEFRVHKLPPLKQTTFALDKNINYEEDYYYPDLPYPISIAIPKNAEFFVSERSDVIDEVGIFITTSCNTTKRCHVIIDTKGVPESIQEWKSIWNYKNDYNMIKKLFSERVGLIHTMLLEGLLIWHRAHLWESKINEFDVFITETFTPSKRTNKEIPDTRFYLLLNKGLTATINFVLQELDDARPIMATVRPQTPKTAPEYYERGLKFLEGNEFHKAKASFASALYFDWENPDYHFAMARSHYESEAFTRAKRRLESLLEFRPNYPGAKKLLENTQKKLLQKKIKKSGVSSNETTS